MSGCGTKPDRDGCGGGDVDHRVCNRSRAPPPATNQGCNWGGVGGGQGCSPRLAFAFGAALAALMGCPAPPVPRTRASGAKKRGSGSTFPTRKYIRGEKPKVSCANNESGDGGGQACAHLGHWASGGSCSTPAGRAAQPQLRSRRGLRRAGEQIPPPQKKGHAFRNWIECLRRTSGGVGRRAPIHRRCARQPGRCGTCRPPP